MNATARVCGDLRMHLMETVGPMLQAPEAADAPREEAGGPTPTQAS